MDDSENMACWFGGRVVAENVDEQRSDDGVQPLLDEPVTVGLVLPHVYIAKPAVRPLGREMHDQPGRRLVAEPVHDAVMQRLIDRHILGERIRHDRLPQIDTMLLRIKVEPMDSRVNKRTYNATTRRAQSAATRQRIIDRARDLIVERGYRATTISAIAEQAEVNTATIYELVGRKPVLLRELVEQALSGTDHPIAGADRDYVAAIRDEPNAAAKLDIYARAVTQIQTRMAPLFLALRDASATEPEVADLWREISDRRAANMRLLVAELATTGQLRADLPHEDAADTIWATNSPELYVMLTSERAWNPDRFNQWLADTWRRLLLQDPTD